MKKKKMILSRETLVNLSHSPLNRAQGGQKTESVLCPTGSTCGLPTQCCQYSVTCPVPVTEAE
jgi:hypothetical protein